MTALAERASDLACPSCEGPLAYRDGEVHCTACFETVPVVDGIPRFPVPGETATVSSRFDRLSSIYETPLWFQPMYRLVGGPSAPADDRAALASLLDADGCDVLDVACGTGRFTRYVAGEATFAWGIDLSEGMLRRAREYADRSGVGNVAFARMDANDLRFEDGRFDRVACCWALHLFPEPSTAIAEVRRVLAPGDRFAGTTLVDEYVLAVPGLKETIRRLAGARVFEREGLRRLLEEAGFATVEFDRRGGALFFRAQ